MSGQEEPPKEQRETSQTDEANMTVPLSAISKIEKGGLFVVVMTMLYMGYGIYRSNLEREDKLIVQQLAAITQQQLTIQQQLTAMQNGVNSTQLGVRDIVARLSALEKKSASVIYSGDGYILLQSGVNEGQTYKIGVLQK